YETENFVKEMEYNAELRRRKAKLKKKGRQW
ncbi:hypothetical protein EZS27_021129, partial [termite gut metagenome]